MLKHLSVIFSNIAIRSISNSVSNIYLCITERLRIRIIPTIALIVNGKTKDYIVGFTELGNCDDFPTERLQCRLAQSGVINYGDDPELIETGKKSFIFRPSKPKTIKGRNSNDSDDDCIQI